MRREIVLFATIISSVRSLSQQKNTDNNNNNNNIAYGSLLRSTLISASADNNLNRTTKAADGAQAGWQYWCDPCSVGFNKLKSYKEHLAGKRHKAVIAESEALWEAYLKSGPTFYDPSIAQIDATRAWSLDLFIDGLQARSRSSIKHVLVSGVPSGQIDPSLRLCDLPPSKRAALWRYLYTSGIPCLSFMVAALPQHYVRVKELLESVETFMHVERLMKRSSKHGQKATKISHIYDIGCGHGLVGMLCAASFPHITVHAIDRVPRDSFQAQREAFVSSGCSLSNLSFEAGDLSILRNRIESSSDGHHFGEHSLMLCVHGCKSLTHDSIEMAIRQNWAWLSLPCCLQADNHISEKTSLKVTDQMRFTMLCGAIVAKYEPEIVTTIDSRITGRGIVIASPGKGT
eukprot:CAMPEP_0194080668 /NCGR_PEP_ID=MMETSP0149-20130528/6633_1 /TAXON_ID=122233 /ORGANISM="Chaetoceros debilis, Strain MM31A-1" /LENGTH=401 /DNA_ID=CAMNT_0038762435 /DNA_START=78 /DNA_END=1283 /DNA_ORIENTATION=-